MLDLVTLLWNTILLRPYVFAFFGGYLISAILYLGVIRSLCYIPLGYTVAWLSEWFSIHYGIPYGLYRYIPSTTDCELWVGGVPFMDSFSYIFLSYAAYGTACFLWIRSRSLEDLSSWKLTILSATLLTILDVIIDPVALRGDRWFLGKIYEYPSGGIYFGVPLSNFIGWFIVGILLTRILQFLCKGRLLGYSKLGLPLAVGLYIGIIVFNLGVAIYIRAWEIVIADLCIIFVTFISLRRIFKASPLPRP
ncbi:MAG: carotenoid biosynthesis protein [Syntrophobacterales bacterium]|nr:carotenoid biosynthesis protein [Syntrophobacterales bacterium]